MDRFVLPACGPASPETIEEHLRIGGRWLAEATALYPGLLPEDALVEVQKQGGILDSSSVGRYRADLRHTLLAEMTRTGRLAEFEHAWEKVDGALSARKAKIPEEDRRTSALKVEDATEEEVRKLFYELKRHAMEHGNPNSILACLFVLVAGHAGFRPIELRGASFDGTRLILPNAKKRPGHEPARPVDMSTLPEDVRKGIALLLSLTDHDLTKREFARWQKCLAGQLWRACKRIGIRVLSLYSFRHIAIASWAAAGLSPQEIALLCGHTSIRTAHTHYARAKVGHKRSAVARAAAGEELDRDRLEPGEEIGKAKAELQAQAQERTDSARQLSADPFKFEDMPKPIPKQSDTRSALSPEEVRAGLRRHLDPRPASEIAANIERARKSPAASSRSEPGKTNSAKGNNGWRRK